MTLALPLTDAMFSMPGMRRIRALGLSLHAAFSQRLVAALGDSSSASSYGFRRSKGVVVFRFAAV